MGAYTAHFRIAGLPEPLPGHDDKPLSASDTPETAQFQRPRGQRQHARSSEHSRWDDRGDASLARLLEFGALGKSPLAQSILHRTEQGEQVGRTLAAKIGNSRLDHRPDLVLGF